MGSWLNIARTTILKASIVITKDWEKFTNKYLNVDWATSFQMVRIFQQFLDICHIASELPKKPKSYLTIIIIFYLILGIVNRFTISIVVVSPFTPSLETI